MAAKSLLLALALLGCEEEPPPLPQASHAGEVGYECRPDGSCVSELLRCTRGKLYWGLPMHGPVCLPKDDEAQLTKEPTNGR